MMHHVSRPSSGSVSLPVLLLIVISIVPYPCLGQRQPLPQFGRQPALVVPPPPSTQGVRATTPPPHLFPSSSGTRYGRRTLPPPPTSQQLPSYPQQVLIASATNLQPQPQPRQRQRPTQTPQRPQRREIIEIPERGKVVQAYGDHLQSLHQQDQNFETPNYDYKYQVHGGGNFFGHEESRRDIKTQGQYHVLLPDGRRQIVSYYADESGYHPTVTYELVPDAPQHTPTGRNAPPPPPKGEGYRSKRQFRHGKRVVVRRVKVRKIPKTPEPISANPSSNTSVSASKS